MRFHKPFIKQNIEMLKRIFNFLSSFLYFTPILYHNYICRKSLLLPLYKGKKNSANHISGKTAIYMVQSETTFSGGLSDRLRGITSIYGECKRQGLPFKVVFEPLHLEDYLEPNRYDWRIHKSEICWDTRKVYPCTILTHHHNLKNIFQRFAQRTVLKGYLKKDYNQIHIYSNMATEEKYFSELFNELFKPTKVLQEQLDYHLGRIGGKGNYISMTFRFRQLLGDFKEGGITLPVEKRDIYIDKCINCVRRMVQENPEKRILVTADSSTFLAALQDYEDLKKNVYIIPGKVVHIGFTFDADTKTYMKSFVDYYMLSNASKVYMVRDKLLFNSGFPKRAAMLTNTQYGEINLEN